MSATRRHSVPDVVYRLDSTAPLHMLFDRQTVALQEIEPDDYPATSVASASLDFSHASNSQYIALLEDI